MGERVAVGAVPTSAGRILLAAVQPFLFNLFNDPAIIRLPAGAPPAGDGGVVKACADRPGYLP